jgi:DNA-directed RNA polymerase subunit alpha
LFDVTLPEINRDAASETYGRYRIEPLQPGWGTTLGSSLRRILMSSLKGAAVTAIRLAEMPDDPSEVPGIEESLLDLVLNLKQLRFRVAEDAATPEGQFRVMLRTDGSGAGELTAADLELPEGVEVVDPDLVLATAAGKTPFEVELLVETGQGYSPADARTEVAEDMLPIDAMYTPVPKVNYLIEHTRVGQMTDFDRLLLEIWTDGTMQPDDALSQAARILTQYATAVAGYGRDLSELDIEDMTPPVEDDTDRPLEDLNLSMRTANALKRANINSISQVLALSDADLMSLRNFGQKSLDELRAALIAHGFSTPASDEDLESAGEEGSENGDEGAESPELSEA